MDSPLVVVAGATGALGGRLVAELLALGARVRALVRPEPSRAASVAARFPGAELAAVSYDNAPQLTETLRGGSVVVSTLSGLEDVILGTQSRLLDAAVRAGVPRFIPSDFAIDYTRLPTGSNRNLALREAFRSRLEAAPIRATSILNGAFLDMLTGQAPFILFGLRRILCWGDPDQLMDWTTIDDTARYTARVALDPESPRFLRIAGEELSARKLAALMTDLTGRPHRLLRPGGLALLRGLTAMTRALRPEPAALYPAWQGMQYMHDLYAGRAKFERLDNSRYPVAWTSAREVLAAHLNARSPGAPD